MPDIVKPEVSIYTASALLNIFNNALSNDVTKKLFRIKGIYIMGKGVAYNGVFYDTLKDELTDTCITLIVPGALRNDLIENRVIDSEAYLTKKVQAANARIELQVNLVRILNQASSSITEDQRKIFEILQKKVNEGYKDVDSFIKTRIVQQEPVTVKIITGRNAIVDSDIKHQLKEAVAFFDFKFLRTNVNSEKEILITLLANEQSADILVLARGGGENMEVFNKPSLAEAILKLQSYFITAIGHKEDNSLLQKIADKAFITPTALGQYFNSIYNETKEELQSSKSNLITSITKEVETRYEKQISQLQKQIKFLTLLIVIASIICLLIGKGCK